MNYPFDLNHIRITSYSHLGNAIDFEEVERFRNALGNLLQEVLDKQQPDSPVYTFLDQLIPPSLKAQIETAARNSTEDATGKTQETGKALSLIIEEAEDAVDNSDFIKAKGLFESALIIGKGSQENIAYTNNAYLIQRLAMATYKAALPDKITALKQSLTLLDKLDLEHTNDSETVSLAGAIEKKLYEEGQGNEHLNQAIQYFQRGYYLLNNRYNAINLAFTLNCRASSSLCATKEEQIADMIYANYTRKRVLDLCDKDWEDITKREGKESMLATVAEQEAQKAFNNDQKFWIQINRAEAHFGLGNFEAYKSSRAIAQGLEHANWMMEAFDLQIEKLRLLLQAKSDLLNPAWVEH
jgi:hypothetical protein